METTIRATPENAPLMRKLIAEWPELNNCIDSLRQQGVFPGLRVMSITVPEGCTLEQLAEGVTRAPDASRINPDGSITSEPEDKPNLQARFNP
jgi:hypothetical protein